MTCTTRRPSPSCGRRSATGSTTRRSSPPTTRRSTGASCMPVVPGTDCACHERRSCVPCSSPEPSGEYGRRSCPTSAGGCGSRSVTTTRERTRASCSRPRPTVGCQGSVERTGLRPAPWSAFRPLSAGHGRQACCAGWHSFVRLLQTWWQRPVSGCTTQTMRCKWVGFPPRALSPASRFSAGPSAAVDARTRPRRRRYRPPEQPVPRSCLPRRPRVRRLLDRSPPAAAFPLGIVR